jgi:hypothetical protein
VKRPALADAARGLSAAALVLAITSRGDAAVLAAVLVAVDATPAAAVAVVAALSASSWRWGSTGLDALAGAQAVLGPAAVVGPPWSAVGSCLAAAALVVALSSRVEVLRLLAVGASAAAVLAGPAPGGEIWFRVVAALVATGLAFAVARLVEERPGLEPARLGAGLVLGVGAMVAVAPDAPSWPPEVPLGDVAEGLALALVVAGLVLVAPVLAAHPRWRQGSSRPRLRRADPRRWGNSSRLR